MISHSDYRSAFPDSGEKGKAHRRGKLKQEYCNQHQNDRTGLATVKRQASPVKEPPDDNHDRFDNEVDGRLLVKLQTYPRATGPCGLESSRVISDCV